VADSPLPNAQPCRLWRRLAAIAYDCLLLAAVLFLAAALPLLFTGGEGVKGGSPLMTLWFLFAAFLFFGWFWQRGGQTLGMQAWRIHLLSVEGGAITWRMALLRYLAALLSWLPAGLGFWWAIFDRDHLTWHDRLSGTRLWHYKG
jgi:uncharacterized RDD family membrane protein YckC